jgi:membrane-associated phospholipid phosphatase
MFLHFVPVLLLELAFGLQPVVEVATVNTAAFNVNLKRSLTDFRRGCPSSETSGGATLLGVFQGLVIRSCDFIVRPPFQKRFPSTKFCAGVTI